MYAIVELVRPSERYLSSYVKALQRGWSPDNIRGVVAAREELEQIRTDVDSFFAGFEDREGRGPPVKLPDGSSVNRLPGFRRWLWDGEFSGTIGMRWQPGTTALPPHCLGHIGYAIVPWKQGGFGVIACGAMSPELLDGEIAGTKERTEKPFGVNLITMHPQLEALIDVCSRHAVSHVVLAGGLPPAGAIDRIKGHGAKLIAFAPALALAKKLMRAGADALVIEGMEAGGHIGPVSTSVLCQEILPDVAAHIPVFVAGGIGRGEAIAAYLEMGAVGVQLGTRFVCAHESIAHANFKKAFIRASARDAIPSVQIDPRLPVIPVRALKNREMENFAAKQREVAQQLDDGAIEMAEAQLQIEHYWAGALRRAAIDGDVESGSVMAGQSVGMVKREEPVAEIVQELVDEAAAALGSRG